MSYMVCVRVFLGLMLVVGSAGAQVILSVPADTTVEMGSTFWLPIRTTELKASDQVTAFNFALQYPADVLALDSTKIVMQYNTPSYLNLRPGPLMSEASSVLTAVFHDTINIGWYDSKAIVGAGTMFSVGFLVRSNVEYGTVRDIRIMKLEGKDYLNEGIPPSTSQDGVLRVVKQLSVEEERPQPGLPAIIAWPNPFNAQVSLRLNMPYVTIQGGDPVEGTICDLLGQVVRRWTMPSDGRWTWDGRDDLGRPLSSGVYLVTIRGQQAGGEIRHCAAVTLLR